MRPTISSELTLYAQKTVIRFRYTNYKLETEQRKAKVLSVWFGSSQYHQGPQWFLMAYDMDRLAIRNFAMRDMSEVVNSAMAPVAPTDAAETPNG